MLSQNVEGIKYSIYYLGYLRSQPPWSGGVTRIDVTDMLVDALACHIVLVAGDETATIQVMLRLCYELLRLAPRFSGCYPVKAFCGLIRGITVEFSRGLQMDSLDQVVDCLREAVKTYPPELRHIHLDFATALQFRFMQTYCEDDYKEAIAVLDKIIVSNHLTSNSTPSSVLACITMARFTILRCKNGRPEYIEEAISRCHSWLGYSTHRDRGRSTLILLLKWCLDERSKQFGLKGSSIQVNSSVDSVIIFIPSSHTDHDTMASDDSVFRSMNYEQVMKYPKHLLPETSSTPTEISKDWTSLSSFAFMRALNADRTGDITDVEEAIKYQKMALASLRIPNFQAECSHLQSLHRLLRQAFDRTGAVQYLEDRFPSIVMFSKVQLRNQTTLKHLMNFLGH